MTAALFACAVVAAASALQGTVGFGMALVAAPLLVLFDPGFVPGPLICAGLALTLASALRERHAIDFSGVAWGVLGRLPGTALGAAALAAVPAERMGLAVGALVLVAVAMSATGVRLVPTARTVGCAGFLSGFMGTASSIGGPPLALVYQHASGPRLRATLAGYFVIGGAMSLVALALVGRFGPHELELALVLLPGALLGFAVSGRLLPVIDRGHTRSAVLWVAALAGLLAIAQQLARPLASQAMG